MAQQLEFGIVRTTESLSLSPKYAIPFSLPDVYAGESLFFKIYICAPDPASGSGALKILDPTGLGLRVAIGAPADVLNSTTLSVTGSAGDKHFEGKLSLAVSGVTGLFTAGQTTPVQKTIEFEISDSGDYQKIQFDLNIWNQLITSTLVDVESPDVALSKREAAASYVPMDNKVNGGGFILRNETGDRFLIYVGTDEDLHAEKVS